MTATPVLPLFFTLDNGVVLEFAFEQKLYRGLRKATLDGRIFLVQGRGQVPYFVTPEGISYFDFRLLGHEATDTEVMLEFEAIGRIAPVQQGLDVFNFPLVGTLLNAPVSDTFRIRIKARTLEVGGEICQGFEISYEFSSDHRSIHWLYESIAIAPDGQIEGARVMAQNMSTTVCPLESVLENDTLYSTEENYGAPCIQSPARGGGSQIFDLVQGEKMAVVSFFASAAKHGKTLKANLQKLPLEEFVTVSDIHYGKLAGNFASVPRIVMAMPRSTASREDAINRWTAWFDFSGKLWRRELGIHPTASVPTLTFEGTGIGGVHAGTTYPELLKVWAERLDWVVEQGFKAVNLHTPEWISAATEPNLVFKGNDCCPWEFKLSGLLGGEEGLRIFCEACHARGIKVYVWIAGHLHRESPVWKEHPEWVTRTPNQSLWDGLYGIIHSMSFAHGAGDWVLNDLIALRKKTGLDGVWIDSFAGLVLHTVNWQSPDRVPNAPSVLRFLGDLSEAGFEIMIEGLSQLGVSSWGNLRPAAIAGKEEVMLNTNLRYFIKRDWKDPAVNRDFYFRMLAARAPVGVWLEEFLDEPEDFPVALPAWFGPLSRAFNQVSDRMDARTVSGQGVLWRDAEEKPSAYFALNSSPAGNQDGIWRDLLTGAIVSPEGSFQAGQIYESVKG